MNSNFFCKTFHCMNVYAESSEQVFSLKQKPSGYMKGIESSGYGFQVMVSEPGCRPLHSTGLAAKNSKQGIFSGQASFSFMKSIDSSGFGLPIICSKYNYKEEAELL